MASTTRATKQVHKALDSNVAQRIIESTRVATGNQKARVDPQTPIQGKPREVGSNAYKEHEKRESARLQKALNAVSHGKNIFAYTNLRTKQVVYSLTRYLEEHKVLNQLIYHGKKTVPAELRRDMWAPYYSVHFSNSRLGLRAFQLLREFSVQRQLAPPQEMITVSEDFLAAKRPRKPTEAEEFDKRNLKRIGLTMEKRERARVLMNQRATSVADIAAVVSIQDEAIANGFLTKNTLRGILREDGRGRITRRARQRQEAAFQGAAEKAEEQQARVEEFEAALAGGRNEDIKIAPSDAPDPENPGVVSILWRDVEDAHHAQSWSENVRHGKLQLTRDAQLMPLETKDSKLQASGEQEQKQ